MLTGLIADIGGTNIRFALVNDYGETLHIKNLLCSDYAGPIEATLAYLAELNLPQRPRRAAFCVAGPVKHDHINVTNNHWEFSQQAVKQQLGLDHLKFVNDFTAVALSAPRLRTIDYFTVGGGKADDGPITVLGPGTGLGVSGLVVGENKQFLPISGEGGHVALAATNDREAEVIAQLRRDVGFVSAEQVLSGFGLVNLYNALSTLSKQERQVAIKPADITQLAQNKDPVALEAINLFCAFLGTVASDMALTLYSTGGVFIAGGIVPRLGELFTQSPFRSHFEEKGIYKAFMQSIPTAVVTHTHPAFVGLGSMVLNRM